MRPLLLAALMIVPVMTACSHTLTDQKGLIYVTSTPPTASSDGSQSSVTSKNAAGESSETYSSGTGSKAPKSSGSSGAAANSKKGNSSSGTTANSKKSSSSSGTGSSSSGGNDVIDPPTKSDIISLYNNAVVKNTSLQGVEYETTLLINGKETINEADVKIHKNNQYPVFDIIFDLGEVYFEPQTGVEYITINGKFQKGIYNSSDFVGYITILDTSLSAADVNSCTMVDGAGGREVSMEAVNYADYDGIYKICSCSGAPISRIDLEYTITGDGFISASKQTFKLSDGETLEMDKNYINIGSEVTIIKPRTN
jgi:hypothetical protein